MSASISVSCNSIVRQRSPFPRRSGCRPMGSGAAEAAGSVVGGIVVIWLGAIGDVPELPASDRFGFVGNHAARANFSSIGKQSAAILNSSGKVAYRSATNVVAVARRKSSFFSSARQRRLDSPFTPAGGTGPSSLERKIAADDRPTLTFRTLTAAAFGVLLLAPEAIVHPSFQMSFAATLALVAGYQQGLSWMSQGGDTPLAAKVALWGGREIVGLVIVSLLAGTATIPYIAYHFHRIAPQWGGRKSACNADRIRVGHAGWNSRIDEPATRPRRLVLAAHGGGHRMDDARCQLGDEFSRSAWARCGLRARSASPVYERTHCALSLADALALHRGVDAGRRHYSDDSSAPA